MDEFAWAYAVGRIKVVEKELLPGSAFRQMAETPDISTAAALLKDTRYGPYLAQRRELGNALDLPLQEALRDAYDSVSKYAGEPLAVTAFRARHDFHNVKVEVKRRCLGIPAEEEAYSVVGNVPVAELERVLSEPSASQAAEGAPSGDPQRRADVCAEKAALRAAFAEAASLVEGERSRFQDAVLAFIADGSVDRSYYRWASSQLKKLGYPGLREFLSAEADLANLRMALRSIRTGLTSELFARTVLDGGEIPSGEVLGAFEEGLGSIRRLFSKAPFSALAASGVSHLERAESLTSWEKRCDDYLVRLYKKARYFSLGPEPVVGYLLGKEAEVRNLRVVFAGKEAGLPPAEIVERLRETYA